MEAHMSQGSATKQTDDVKNAAEAAASMKPKATPEHQWLRKLVGEWTYETSDLTAAGPSVHSTGRERGRAIGDIWVQLEGDGEMPDGSPATTVMTLGYDPATKKIIGTWIGSMMTHQWVYDGTLDSAKNTLVLESDGPSMTGDGTMARYRDTIAFANDNERTLTASVEQPDGSWKSFMSMTYRRKT
jgi:hypothetical protein